MRVLEFQAAEREVEIQHLQHAIQRERAKAERHDSNLQSAQALAKMLQVRLEDSQKELSGTNRTVFQARPLSNASYFNE